MIAVHRSLWDIDANGGRELFKPKDVNRPWSMELLEEQNCGTASFYTTIAAEAKPIFYYKMRLESVLDRGCL